MISAAAADAGEREHFQILNLIILSSLQKLLIN